MEVYLEPEMPKTNDVIISDTMLRSLAPPQLRPMTDNHKIICGYLTSPRSEDVR